jgi:hypothetical protein
MIEVHYELVRSEGSSEIVFHPDESIQKIENNIVLIEAPNGRGKSFFLNTLALGLYGNRLTDKESHISPSLKERIKEISDRTDQTLTFDIKITTNNGPTLISKKESPKSTDIKVYEINDNGKTSVPYRSFLDKYYFIYDIPESPIKRLPHLVEEIKLHQSRYKDKVSRLKETIENIKREIKSSKNPEEIKRYRDSVAEFESKKEILEENKRDIAQKLDIIETYHIYSGYDFNLYLHKHYEDKIKNEKKKVSNLKRDMSRKSTEFNRKYIEVENATTEMEEIFDQLCNIFDSIFKNKDHKKHIKIWMDIDLSSALTTFEFDERICKEIGYFKKEAEKLLSDEQLSESGKIAVFYKELLEIIKPFNFKEIVLPGTEKTIENLQYSIQEEYSNHQSLANKYNKAKNSVDLIDSLKKLIINNHRPLEDLKILKEKKDRVSSKHIDPIEINSTVDDFNNRLKTVEKKLRNYESIAYNKEITDFGDSDINYGDIANKIREKNPELQQYFDQNEDEREKSINEHSQQVDTLTKQINDTTNSIKVSNERLKELQERKPHKYQNYFKDIENIYATVDKLERKLIKYNQYIDAMEKGTSPQNSGSYAELISKYLASKIPQCPYIDDLLTPEEVDIVNRVIIADNGQRKIKFNDISTGQGMSIYLRTLLKRPIEDNRKVIAIFDEVATMDQKSLKPIINTLKELDKQNRLLFAIFVQRGEDEYKVTGLD